MNRYFEVVQRLVSRGEYRARLNKTWQEIHDETGLGVIVGKEVAFTAEERQKLRVYIQHKTGLDPSDSKVTVPATRHETSKINADEKTFKATVFSHLLRVGRASGDPIQTIHDDAILPVGCFLSIAASNLDLTGEVVVIVENGDLMSHLHELNWPDSLCNALFIYRGHSHDVNKLKFLLKESYPKRVLGFFDFDPAGLLIGLENSIGFDGLVIPEIEEIANHPALLRRINQPSVFFTQSQQLNRLQTKVSNALAVPVRFMLESNIAIMQESMAAHALSLTEVSVR